MKVKQRDYITKNKPLFKKLVSELLKDYQYVSLLAQDSFAKTYTVSRAGINANENEMFSAIGYVVKVYDGGCYAEYSDNTISEEEIKKICKKVKEELTGLGSRFVKSQYDIPKDEECVFSKSTDYEIDPEEFGDEAIIERLKKVHETGMSKDSRIVNFAATITYQKYSKLFLSRNKDMEQNVLWTTGAVQAVIPKGEEMKLYYNPVSLLGGIELIDKLDGMVDDAVKGAIELSTSERIVPGEYECICDPAVTGMIVHEAFGHGVEMDMFVKDRALAKSFIGKYVASPLVTMHDGNAVNDTATYFFDDEGTLAQDTVIIDKGILVAGMSDLQSAMALGSKPTGNGKRESFERKAYTRMTNTYFEAGKDKVEDMIASIKDGVYLCIPYNGMEDPKNWGIQCMVLCGKEIKDGKFTGKIFSPLVLTGYVPDLLKSISMVSDKLETCGSGACGKGYKEWVKVSDGGPYIKARVRLG